MGRLTAGDILWLVFMAVALGVILWGIGKPGDEPEDDNGDWFE